MRGILRSLWLQYPRDFWRNFWRSGGASHHFIWCMGASDFKLLAVECSIFSISISNRNRNRNRSASVLSLTLRCFCLPWSHTDTRQLRRSARLLGQSVRQHHLVAALPFALIQRLICCFERLFQCLRLGVDRADAKSGAERCWQYADLQAVNAGAQLLN